MSTASTQNKRKPYLTSLRRQVLLKPSLLQPRLNKYIPHDPTPKQAAFTLLPHLEAMFGGAAYGGKSDGLLIAALQYVDLQGYNALILRRTFRQLALPEAIMTRSHEWLSRTDAHWSGEKKMWSFPSGSTLTFGHMEHEAVKYDYQGGAFHMVGFDEMTQFTETMYLYLFSRLRRLKKFDLPIRMRGASNPGGIGHEWVKSRFIISKYRDRIFIPATLADNPFVNQEEYRRTLANLDPVTRRQLEDGDWDVLPEGKKFKRDWFQVVRDYPRDCRLVRYWDIAATEPKPGTDPDYTVGSLMGESHGIYYLIDVLRTRRSPGNVENLIKQTAIIDGIAPSVWMEQEPGASGKSMIDYYQREVLKGYDFRGDKVTGSKEVRANPMSAAAEAGNLKLLEGEWNNDWLRELCAFPTDGVHDDQVDSASGAHNKLSFAGKVSYKKGTREAA